MHVRFEALEDVRGNVGRLQAAVRQLVDARDLPPSGRDAFALTRDRAFVTDRTARDLRNGDLDFEFLLEFQRTVVFAGGGHPGPPDRRIPRMDAQPRLTPQRVLRVLEVAEEVREMHD